MCRDDAPPAAQHSAYASQVTETGATNECAPPFPLSGPRPEESPAPDSSFVSFRAWAMSLVPRILRTRAPFAAALKSSLHISWSKPASAHALFPLPVPFPGIFQHVPGASGRKRSEIARRRVVHTIVVALNYLHGGRVPTPLHLLRRRPNPAQLNAFLQVESFVQACGDVSFKAEDAGRRSRELHASLGRLCTALCVEGPSADPYGSVFPGFSSEIAPGARAGNAAAPLLPSLGTANLPSSFSESQQVAPPTPLRSATAASAAPLPGAPADAPSFSPYGPLNASRLKLSGTGRWDPTGYLPDSLAYPFLDPSCLLHGGVCPGSARPDVSRENASEIISLALLWDRLGLLHLESSGLASHDSHHYVRIFNCAKNQATDRQIGDRRGRNFAEFPVHAASSGLPTGPLLLSLYANPCQEWVALSVTDRRDFYHQFRCTAARSRSNMLFPPVPSEHLQETSALKDLVERMRAPVPPFSCGIHGPTCAPSPALPSEVFVCFKSVLQGDHLGVELATASHRQFLSQAGCLDVFSELRADAPFPSTDRISGLVIDDLFSVSIQDISVPPDGTAAAGVHDRALAAYHDAGLEGSPGKDVRAASLGKVAGCEIDSSERTRSWGRILAGAPREKRLCIASVTLAVATLPQTTDSLHLSLLGAWTSIIMYRRPLMTIFRKAFSLVSGAECNPYAPRYVALPRSVADELVLAAVLAPMMASDLGAPWLEQVFATDACETGGAIVSAPCSLATVRELWRASDRKGGPSRVLAKEEAMLRRIDPDWEERTAEPFADDRDADDFPSIGRPLTLRFASLGLGFSSACCLDALASRGWQVGPWLDLSPGAGPEIAFRAFLWALYLLESGRLDSLVAVPPVASFSPSCVPPLRSWLAPFGFRKGLKKVRHDSCVALRCILLVAFCEKAGVPAVIIQPQASIMRALPSWRALRDRPACVSLTVSLNSFGAPCVRPCEVLGVHLFLDSLGGDTHGAGTCEDIPPLPGLSAELLSADLDRAIQSRISRVSALTPDTEGLENAWVNDLALTATWTTEQAFLWPRPVHINILETSTFGRLMKMLAARGGNVRFASLIDSNVARCSLAKGRSSSRALSQALDRVAATAIGYGLYAALPFCPTRLMPADGPSRQEGVKEPGLGLCVADYPPELSRVLLALPRIRRWAANWVRLVLLLGFRPHSDLCASARYATWSFRLFCRPHLDFDSTLGFPGEGPLSLCSLWHVLGWWFLVVGIRSPFCHGAPEAPVLLLPRNQADKVRQARRAGLELSAQRQVEAATRTQRDRLWSEFELWLSSAGVGTSLFDAQPPIDIDSINAVLSRYGRELFAAGRPYGHYAETVNALASRLPTIRRMLQPAWDVAFNWLRHEPHIHHYAMPWQVLLAMLTVCCLWGWPTVGGVLALAWGGLARIGEVLAAKRRDLVLPQDLDETVAYALLSILEPKTRNRAARHQALRLDQPYLLEFVVFAFGPLKPGARLWPMAGQTLRNRYRALLQCLALLPGPRGKQLDLASLRAGGATWLMQVTEDSELTRRRGRWLNSKIMEIYVQEVTAVLFLPLLSQPVKQQIFDLMHSFPTVFQFAQQLQAAGVPPHKWYNFFRRGLGDRPREVG